MPETAIGLEQKVESVKSDNFVKIYANSAHIEVTVWDFSVIFGEIVKSGDKMVVEQSVKVSMSPQHAKALAGILAQNVKDYETHIGRIALPVAEEAPPASSQLSTPKPAHK